MRARLVENIDFKRGTGTKKAMNVGIGRKIYRGTGDIDPKELPDGVYMTHKVWQFGTDENIRDQYDNEFYSVEDGDLFQLTQYFFVEDKGITYFATLGSGQQENNDITWSEAEWVQYLGSDVENWETLVPDTLPWGNKIVIADVEDLYRRFNMDSGESTFDPTNP